MIELYKKINICSPNPDIALLHTYIICKYIIYRYKQTAVYFDQYKIMVTRLAGIYAIAQGFVKTKKLFTLK